MIRDEILDAAAQIFRQKGYHAASMSEIAETVNLQKGSLYYHVSSKQELLLDLLNLGLNLLIERIGSIASEQSPPPTKLIRVCESYIEILADHADLTAVLIFEHRSLDPIYQERHFPRRDQFEQIWIDLIQEGVEAGDLACPDAPLAAKYLLGVLNWTITWYRPSGPLSSTEIGRQIGELFLDGALVRT